MEHKCAVLPEWLQGPCLSVRVASLDQRLSSLSHSPLPEASRSPNPGRKAGRDGENMAERSQGCGGNRKGGRREGVIDPRTESPGSRPITHNFTAMKLMILLLSIYPLLSSCCAFSFYFSLTVEAFQDDIAETSLKLLSVLKKT